MIVNHQVGEAWIGPEEKIAIIHARMRCEGTSCCIHNPSPHHMRDWPLNIRFDRPDLLAERICEHGVGHPDPDALAHIVQKDPENTWSGVHGCDGCCTPPFDGEGREPPPDGELEARARFNEIMRDFVDTNEAGILT